MKKKYDVYGIGNALVDIEVEVSDQYLKKNKIEKGFMTLVDADRQAAIIETIESAAHKMQCGGSAANTVIAVSQFGGKCFYSCKVANDKEGKFYIKNLAENGVESNLTDQNPEDGITGKCLVLISPDAERTMNTYLGITANYSTRELIEDKLINAEYLYIEGYLISSKNGREAMHEAKKIAENNGVKVALTFSDPSMVKYFGDELKELIGASVDLLFCNEEEAKIYTGKDSISEAREVLGTDAKKFAITQGSNGAIIFDGDTFIDIEPFPVKAIDTNGAGDMFAGAFLYAITHGHSYAGAGKLASMASSEIVGQFGPRLKWHQAQEVLNKFI